MSQPEFHLAPPGLESLQSHFPLPRILPVGTGQYGMGHNDFEGHGFIKNQNTKASEEG